MQKRGLIVTKERKSELTRLAGEAMRHAVYKYNLNGSVKRNDGDSGLSIFLYARSSSGAAKISESASYTFKFLDSFSNQHLLLNHLKANTDQAAKQILKETNDVV